MGFITQFSSALQQLLDEMDGAFHERFLLVALAVYTADHVLESIAEGHPSEDRCHEDLRSLSNLLGTAFPGALRLALVFQNQGAKNQAGAE